MKVPVGKFASDLRWNAAAFGLSAVFGVLLNVLIVRWYDAASLGVFNQVYAVYILLSQLAVGGVHLAVQAFVPRELFHGRRPDVFVTAAMVLSLVTSTVVMTIAWAGRDLPGRWFESPAVSEAFPTVIWGLLFFSWNKVLLSFHNGARRMKLFAAFQLFRTVLLLAGMVVLGLMDAGTAQLPQLLAWAELVLFLVVLPISLRSWWPMGGGDVRSAMGESFRFGNKALTGNFLLDINTRVDVFLLGILLNDRAVGLYSFAATVAEGAMQLPVLLRNNINPVLSKAWNKGGAPLLSKVMARSRAAFFRMLAPLLGASILLFPLAAWMLGMEEDPLTVWSVYALLIAGLFSIAGRAPFLMLFSQLGFPGTQTVLILCGFLINVLLNLLFIPMLGISGAALATGLATVCTVLVQRVLAARTLGIRF